jgi:hypothetical protein
MSDVIPKAPMLPKRRIPKKIGVPIPPRIEIKFCDMCGNNRLDPESTSEWCQSCQEFANKKGSIKRKLKMMQPDVPAKVPTCTECRVYFRLDGMDYCEWCYDEWVRSRLEINGFYFTNTGTYIKTREGTMFQDKATGEIKERKLVFPPAKPKPQLFTPLPSIKETENLDEVTGLMDVFEI